MKKKLTSFLVMMLVLVGGSGLAQASHEGDNLSHDRGIDDRGDSWDNEYDDDDRWDSRRPRYPRDDHRDDYGRSGHFRARCRASLVRGYGHVVRRFEAFAPGFSYNEAYSRACDRALKQCESFLYGSGGRRPYLNDSENAFTINEHSYERAFCRVERSY